MLCTTYQKSYKMPLYVIILYKSDRSHEATVACLFLNCFKYKSLSIMKKLEYTNQRQQINCDI